MTHSTDLEEKIARVISDRFYARGGVIDPFEREVSMEILSVIREEERKDLEYAQRLATVAAAHYGPPEGWKPLDDMSGVLSQIDNALTGLVRATPNPQDEINGRGE